MDAITQALAAIERLKLLGPGAVTGRLPADPAYGPPRPSLGGYAADPGMTGLLAPPAPAPAPASGAGPTGLLSAPPSPGAAPPVGNPPPMLPPPQPISPMVGAPQPISPLVTGGKLPELPAGGMAQQGGKGFWDFLQEPEVRRGLMEAGMRMLAASAPSTDPRAGSFGYALSQGLGGFMKGRDDVRDEQRQAENDRINQLYKQATIDSMNAPEKPNIETFYDPATGRERKGWYDYASGQINWVGGAKAAPAGAGGGGSGGGVPKTAGLPSGYMWGTDPNGNPVAVPIPGVAPKGSANTPLSSQSASIVVEDIDRALSRIENSSLPTTGLAGGVLSLLPGTEAYDVGALIDTVKANAGFDRLQEMRNSSPTGGALGQVSEREIAYLQSVIGNLSQSQSKEQLVQNLKRVRDAYDQIINGPQGGGSGGGSAALPPGFVEQ